MKTIVKIRELTLVCEEVPDNGVQAKLGLSYVTSMPKQRGMIFYLSEQVSHMVTGNMQFHVDICPIRNGITTDVVQVAKIIIEMNYGLMKEYGIVEGSKVEITRELDGCGVSRFLDLYGYLPETQPENGLPHLPDFLPR